MEELKSIRIKIDEVDKSLVELYLKRMALTASVAEYKIATGKEVFDKEREQQKISSVMSLADGKYEKEALGELFEQIMSISRKKQYRLIREHGKIIDNGFDVVDEIGKNGIRVVYQGTDGAYSQMALKKYFGDGCESYNVETWRDAMEDLKEGRADYAVIPIENTVAGAVSENLDLLSEYGHCIVAELVLKINHVLLGKRGTSLDSIKKIYSHPQALSQCSHFLENHRQISAVAVKNTALAAKMVKESDNPEEAAIGNRQNSRIYDLDILEENIVNVNTNATRFLIVSKEKIFVRNSNKISISFELPHEKGTLYHMLSHISYNGLNLSKIESRPIPGRNFEYRFYVDFEGNLMDEAVQNAITGMKSEAGNFSILGCYVRNIREEDI